MREVLQLTEHSVVTLIGAGGKTSMMYHLAEELVKLGQRILVTTTTKIFFLPADQERFVQANTEQELIEQLEARVCPGSLLVAGRGVEDGKVLGIEPEWVDRLAELELFDLILVEGDGSARKPLKAPAAYEPVIPNSTTLLLPVMGIQAVGQLLSDQVVHRAALFTELTMLGTGNEIGVQHYYRAFFHPAGYDLSGEKKRRKVIPIINQVDDQEMKEQAERLAKLFLRAGLSPVLLTSFEDSPILCGVYR